MKALILILILSFSIFAQQKSVVVTAKRANIRETPSPKSKVVGSVKLNDILPVFANEGEWYYVTSGKIRGWVHYSAIGKVNDKKLLDLSQNVIKETKEEWVLYAKTSDSFLYYRTKEVKEVEKDIFQFWGKQKRFSALENKAETLMLYQVNCRLYQSKNIQMIIYNKDGSIYDSAPFAENDFKAPTPNTYGEVLLSAFCEEFWTSTR